MEKAICYECGKPVKLIDFGEAAICTEENCPNYEKRLQLQSYTLNGSAVYDEGV